MYTIESNLCAILLMKAVAFIVEMIDKDFNTVRDLFLKNNFGALMMETDISFTCHYHFMREITFI